MKLDQWPTYCTCATDERLTLETSALGTPDSGQFTLSTQFTKPHYLVIPLFSPFPSPSPSPPPHPHKGSTAKVTPFIQMKVNTIAFPHSKASRLGILYPHNSPNFFPHFQKSQYLEQVLKQRAQEEKKNSTIDHVKLLHLL